MAHQRGRDRGSERSTIAAYTSVDRSTSLPTGLVGGPYVVRRHRGPTAGETRGRT